MSSEDQAYIDAFSRLEAIYDDPSTPMYTRGILPIVSYQGKGTRENPASGSITLYDQTIVPVYLFSLTLQEANQSSLASEAILVG